MFENSDLFSKKLSRNKGVRGSLLISVKSMQAFFVNHILENRAHFSASFAASLESVKKF